MATLAFILPWLQIVIAVLLVGGILFQHSQEGLGSAFGGSGNSGVTYTKRGFERNLFIATIILALLFTIANLLTLFVS